MEPGIIVVGLLLVLVGGAIYKFPHDVRNFVSSREWQTDPERAERKQELYAKIVGVFVAGGLGAPSIVVGLVL